MVKPLKRKPIWHYIKRLDSLDSDFVGDSCVAATYMDDKPFIQLYIKHAENNTQWGRMLSVTHEVIHQVHHLKPLVDAMQDKQQEDAIETLSQELLHDPAWLGTVLSWLESAQNSELRIEAGTVGGGFDLKKMGETVRG